MAEVIEYKMHWLDIIIAAVFAAFGLGTFAGGILCWVRSRQAASWPVVEGTMNSCDLKSESDGETTCEVVVNYSYKVSGREYQGTHIAFDYGRSGRQKEHTALHNRLARVQTLAVRYDPSNPSRAVLSCKLGTDFVVCQLMCLLFSASLIGLAILSSQASETVIYSTFLFGGACFVLGIVFEKKRIKSLIDAIEIYEEKVANRVPEDTARRLADPQR